MSEAQTFGARYGPWSLVAGASEGLGRAFAVAAAARGLNVLAVARRRAPLEFLCHELAARYGVEARALPLDLGSEDAFEHLARATTDLDVGLLVYNAAHSSIGPFLEHALDSHLREIAVNVRAPLALTYVLAGRMRDRGRGGIVLMSSLAARQGGPFISTYAATKAFSLVLAEGLWDELRGAGVDVIACCPGPTRTPGYLASLPDHGSASPIAALDPAVVAEETLSMLGRTPSVVPGRANRVASFVMERLLPRRTAIAIMARNTRQLQPRA